MSVKTLQKEILALSRSEQIELALFLTNALNGDEDSLLTNEQLSEINNRLNQYESGKIKAVNSSEAMASLYAKYKS